MKHLLTALAALAPIGALAQFHCLGITFNGLVYSIDMSSGTGVLVGNSGLAGTNCMCRENDKWLTVDNTGTLYKISSSTASPTLIHQLNLGGNTDVRGICTDVNLGQYVVVDHAGSDQLWKIDTSNGVGTLVGDMGSTTIQGLAVGFNGRLYAYDVSTTNAGGLREVNPLTGATADLDPTRPGQPGIQDICPNASLGLAGARDSLFRLSAVNGFETLVGSGGYSDIRGLARRQSTFQVDGMSVKLGRLDSGGLASILRREGDTALISKFFVPNLQADPINVEVTYGTEVSAAQLTSVGVLWVGRMNASGQFLLNLDFLNVNTGQFDTISTGTVGTALTELLGGLTGNLAPYFNANKRLVARFRIKPNGPVVNPNWGVIVEMVRGEYTADF
ncbi:MAG: hypothetical protein JSS66_03760 [Armatimonadetes bacterium]|nr:hypothetical protein [Armatimonadota bacterium]